MTDERSISRHIRDLAIRAFGEEDADRWLNTASRFFDGRTPMEMIWSADDAGRVMDFIRELLGMEEQMQAARIPVRDR